MALASDDLVVFDAIVRTGGLSPAARELGRTPSAITRALDRLEAALDARLFHRNTRVLRLTAEGERFRAHAARVLDEVEAAERSVHRERDAVHGRLRVTASATFAALHLAPVFGELLRRHRALRLDLVLTDEVVDLVDRGIDLAIRIGRPAGPDLVVRRLAPDRKLVYAAPAYLAREGTPAHPAELERHRCIVIERAELWPFREPGAGAAAGAVGRSLAVRVPVTVRTNHGEFALRAAEAGLGLARLSEWHARDALAAGRLVRVLPEHADADEAVIAAVSTAGRRLPARTRALLELLRAHFSRPPW